jgi:hypothetical protein
MPVPIIATSCPHPPCGGARIFLDVWSNAIQAVRGNVVSFGLCPHCELPIAILLKPHEREVWTAKSFRSLEMRAAHDLEAASGWKAHQVFPAPPVKGAPELTPADIAKIYRQAHSLLRKDQCEAAVYLFAKVLEQSFSTLGVAAGPLLQCIDAVADAGRIPRIIPEWAREVRLVAEGPGISNIRKQDARAAAEFTEAFLLSAFSLQSKYEARQSGRTRDAARIAAE